MKFQVLITPSAKADIFEINTWLLKNYPDVAEKWLYGINLFSIQKEKVFILRVRSTKQQSLLEE